MTDAFTLLIIPYEGAPRRDLAPRGSRNEAVREGQQLVQNRQAKVVIVYKGLKPTQLLVYRPQTYVHIERI